MQEFLDLFIPRKDQFIRAIERAETKSPPAAGQPCLSAQMQDSWDSGRFWFNLASRKSFGIDEVYWEALHRNSTSKVILDEATLAAKERFVKLRLPSLRDIGGRKKAMSVLPRSKSLVYIDQAYRSFNLLTQTLNGDSTS